MSTKGAVAISSSTKALEFADIPDYPGYRACNNGTIWSFCAIAKKSPVTWKQLKPNPRKRDGRKRVPVKRADGTRRLAYVSNLVLEAFVGPRPDGMECCHWDGNCLNDELHNLRWDTHVNNIADMKRQGRVIGRRLDGTRKSKKNLNKEFKPIIKPYRHSRAKLTESDVLVIRRRLAEGEVQKEIAKSFGVSSDTVMRIANNETWRYLGDQQPS